MTQTITQPTQIKTPAAQSLELLTRIAAGIEAQNAKLAALTEAVTHLLEVSGEAAESSALTAEGLSNLQQALATWSQPVVTGAASTVTATPTGPTISFMAESISLGFDEKTGAPVYKIRGGSYQKFGVRVWQEALPLLGINPADLKPGLNAFCKPVIALMGEKGPRKVIGLAA